MKFGVVSGSGLALMLVLAAPMAWGQANTLGTRILNATNDASGGHNAAVANPAEHPAGEMGLNGTANEQQYAGATANFVATKIAQAKAQGKDVKAAEAQEQEGVAELQDGQNNEAAQHFDTALLALGLVPNAQGQLSGELGARHAHLAGANPPGPNAPVAPTHDTALDPLNPGATQPNGPR